MKKILTIIFLILTTIPSAYADSFVPQSPTEGLSPNAKSFQRYGDIPVSLYTGIPSISIPLSTLREGRLTHPIELSYHSGGIKADEHPGWTGLGWTLIAGGAITREIRDLPDETRIFGYSNICKDLKLDEATPAFAAQFTNNIGGHALSPAGDSEPDKFSFQFPGYSGFFMMDSDGKWQVYSDRPLRVRSVAPTPPAITFPNGAIVKSTQEPIYCKFILTADDGTEYTFGQEAVELSINSEAQTESDWIATAWYLAEIHNPNGDRITFTYERGDFIVSFFKGSVNYSISGTNHAVSMSGIGGKLISPVYLTGIKGSTFQVILSSSESTESDYSGYDYLRRSTAVPTSPTSTKTIYCPQGNHSMMDEVNWRKLDEVRFMDYNGTQTRRVAFSYSDLHQQRLTLLGIDIYELDRTVSEKYRFSYNRVELLPSYLSSNTDHWGFYGSQSNNIDSENYKEPLANPNQYGLLSEIIYPTGGRSVLEFEPHTYSQTTFLRESINGQKTAGGFRIRRIVNIPLDGSLPEIKEFRYLSGVLEGKPVYKNRLLIKGPDDRVLTVQEESANSLSAITNNYGFHICYPEVQEIRADSSSIITRFISPTNVGFRDEAPLATSDQYSHLPHSTKAHYRGRPYEISLYSKDGRCVRSTQISYEPLNGAERWVMSLNSGWISITDHYNSLNSPVFFPKYSLYRNYVHSVVETCITEYHYDASGMRSLVSTTYKAYNSAGQLRRDSTETIYHNGRRDTDVTRYHYAWEKDQWYSDHHIKNSLSNIIRLHNGKIVSHIANTYSLYGGIFPVLDRVDELYDGRDTRRLYECGLTDKTGLPVHVIDASGMHTVFLWGHDRLYPVAEIKNADAHSVRTLLGYDPKDAPDDAAIQDKIGMLRQQLPHAMVTGYTYRPYLGITSITDPTGKTTYYDYDWQKRLTLVRNLHGDPVLQYFYNSFSGSSTAPQPSDVTAQPTASP